LESLFENSLSFGGEGWGEGVTARIDTPSPGLSPSEVERDRYVSTHTSQHGVSLCET